MPSSTGDKARPITRRPFALLLAALIIAPLAFGTVEPWSLVIMEVLCFLAVTYSLRPDPTTGQSPTSGVPGLLPLSLFLLLMLIQTIPLPPALLALLAPGTYHALAAVSPGGTPPGWHPISVDVKATLFELLRIGACAAAYIATFGTMRDRSRLRRAATVIMALATVLALGGIFQHLSAPDRLLFVRPAPEGSHPFGPFVNRNHFAGLMAMALPLMLALAFAWRPWAGGRSGVVASMAHADNQRRTALFFTAVGGAVLVTIATFDSGSRSGALVLAGSVPVFGLLYVLQARRSRAGGLALLGVVLVLMGLALGSVGWGLSLHRLDTAVGLGREHPFMRPEIWRNALHALGGWPLLGAGMGGFGQMFTALRSFPGTDTVLHAHDGYLELLTCGGIAGFALMGWFMLAVLARAARGFPRSGEPLYRYIFIGAATGVFAIMVQELVEFTLQTGAGALYFAFLLGLIATLAQPPAATDTAPRPATLRAIRILAALGLAVSLALNTGAALARLTGPDLTALTGSTTSMATNAAPLRQVLTSAQRASYLDPLDASYHSAACASERLLGNPQSAIRECTAALALKPLDPNLRLQSALALAALKRNKDAGRLFDAAAATGGFDPVVHLRRAQWLIRHGRMDEGLAAMQRAIGLDPAHTHAYIAIMALAGVPDEDMARAMPQLSRPFIAYASYLRQVGQTEAAVRALMDALTQLDAAREANAGQYMNISKRLGGLERTGMALIAVEYGLDRFPDNLSLLHAEARLHAASGRTRQALGIYRHILDIAPADRMAKHEAWRLEDLLKK